MQAYHSIGACVRLCPAAARRGTDSKPRRDPLRQAKCECLNVRTVPHVSRGNSAECEGHATKSRSSKQLGFRYSLHGRLVPHNVLIRSTRDIIVKQKQALLLALHVSRVEIMILREDAEAMLKDLQQKFIHEILDRYRGFSLQSGLGEHRGKSHYLAK
jgi:hypothetical protein